jgi:phosphatidylglycerophosphate synthase
MTGSTSNQYARSFRVLPNLLSCARLVLTAVTWFFALRGDSFLTGIGLLLACLTDALDGAIARRWGLITKFGSQLDSIADQLLIVSALAWLVMLHPEVVTEHPWLFGVAVALYAIDIAVGLIRTGHIANLHLWSSKAAGVLLFIFAVHTFLADAYSPLLLYISVGAFMLCCIEDAAVFLTRDQVDEHIGTIFRTRKVA